MTSASPIATVIRVCPSTSFETAIKPLIPTSIQPAMRGLVSMRRHCQRLTCPGRSGGD